MDVLKDASSAAIYGSRASNGVVIVTTKVVQQLKQELMLVLIPHMELKQLRDYRNL